MTTIFGGRRGKRRWRRCCGASVASWLVEEVGDVETELAGTARGRGGDGGRGVTVARLRLRSGSRGRGSRGGGRVRERVRERSGLRGVAREVQGDEGKAAGSRRWQGVVGALATHLSILLAGGRRQGKAVGLGQ